LVVGGATLHATALVHGLSPIPPPKPDVRDALRERLEHSGLSDLRVELERLDPQTARAIDLNNPARVLRALEVLHSSGRTLHEWQQQPRIPPRFRYRIVRLVADRAWLACRIQERAERMVADGLLAEASQHASQADALRAVIGYREALDVLSGIAEPDGLALRIATATRRYAKRQVTFWNKAFPDAHRLDAQADPNANDLAALLAPSTA
jgi:tRNA dimethylallyltransferase